MQIVEILPHERQGPIKPALFPCYTKGQGIIALVLMFLSPEGLSNWCIKLSVIFVSVCVINGYHLLAINMNRDMLKNRRTPVLP